jgi:capsular polysaccharide biosynthesis protein
MITRANQIAQNEFKDQLNSIDRYQSETEMLINQTNATHDTEQQIEDFQRNEDSDSVAVIFIVGMEVRLIHLASGIARLVTCTTNDRIASAIDKVKLSSPIIVVSSTPPSDNLLSLTQLLNYYYFLKPGRSPQTLTKDSSNVTYVSSIDQLMNQLYHKLGQHYRDSAIQISRQSKDLDKAKRLLNRSTKCYELLKTDTEKTLKRYAEILNKT